MTMTRASDLIANSVFAVLAAVLALSVPAAVDLFGPPLQLGLFAVS